MISRLLRCAAGTFQIALAVLLLSSGPTAHAATPSFAAPVTTTTAPRSYFLAVGDYDGDGKMDVASVDVFSRQVEVHFGDTNVATATIALPGTFTAPGSITAADVKNIGHSQLLYVADSTVYIYDYASGSFSASPQTIDLSSTGISAVKIAVGNLSFSTNLGSRDIVVADLTGSVGVVWIPNDGTGNFGTPRITAAGGSDYDERLVLADVNGDHLDDVILSHPDPNAGHSWAGVLLNTGQGSLSAEAEYANSGLSTFSTSAVAVADVNGDGAPDLAVLGFIHDPMTFRDNYFLSINLNKNDGSGTFLDGQAFALPAQAFGNVEAADLDGDGRAEVVTVNYTSNGFTVHQITGTGANLGDTQTSIPVVGVNYNTVALADMDSPADGKVDVLLGTSAQIGVNPSHSQYVILKNQTSSGGGGGGSLTFSATGPASPGAFIDFQATTDAGADVRVQYSVTPDDDASWANLIDGSEMTPLNSGNYEQKTTAYPVGSGISFRALASKNGTDTTSLPLGPYTLSQADLAIAASITSTSSPTDGAITRIGDNLVYTLTVTNKATANSAPAKSLVVQATVPTFLVGDQTFTVNTTKGSTTVTLVTGDTSTIYVGENLECRNFPSGDIKIVSIQDSKHFTVSIAANDRGNTATRIFDDGFARQFSQSDVTLSLGGTFLTDANTGNLLMSWPIGDLDPSQSQFVRFTVHIGTKVRQTQQVGIGNDYGVYSTTDPRQPAFLVTGFTSHSPNIGTNILGPIKLTVAPLSQSVAPGGLFTYRFTLQNLSSAAIASPIAVVVVPNGARWDDSYQITPGGRATPGVAYVLGSSGALHATLAYVAGETNPQVVIDLGPIAKAGSLHFDVTFQATWTDPADLPQISSINYGAAFLDPNRFVIPGTNTMTTENGQFVALYNASSDSASEPGSTNFYDYVKDPTRKLAVTTNESGVVKINVSGSLDNQPVLTLTKELTSYIATLADDGSGRHVITTAPGQQLTFKLTARNVGVATANDVFIQDRMPDNCTFASATYQLLPDPTPNKLPDSEPAPPRPPMHYVKDADGHHLKFVGFTLDMNETVIVSYTVEVGSAPNGTIISADDPAVAPTSVASVGSSSTPQTPPGSTALFPIEISAPVSLPHPIVRPLLTRPEVSTNISATATALDGLYSTPAKAASAMPIGANAIPGVQRYYIHYENASTVPVSDVNINVPLPAHTVLYRACFVELPATKDDSSLGGLNGSVVKTPKGLAASSVAILNAQGQPLGASDRLTNQTIRCHFNQLPGKPVRAGLADPPGRTGDVMVEVIVLPDAIQIDRTFIGGDPASPVAISHGNSTADITQEAFPVTFVDSPAAASLTGSLVAHGAVAPRLDRPR
jgi:uncharacterized repeat protein (TIGR01451 family)